MHQLRMLFFSSGRYKNDPEILAMTNLIAAYQRNEIVEFEMILKVRFNSLCYCFFFPVW